MPPAVVISATITPTPDPRADNLTSFDHILPYLEASYPARVEFTLSSWEETGRESEGTLTMWFTSGDWEIRTFDADLDQHANLIEMVVKNELTRFRWEGYIHGEVLMGWVASGGRIPKPVASEVDGGWLVYENERYGYQFEYPPEAQVIEMGVDWFETDEKPEGVSNRDYFYTLYERLGSNLCVRLELGDGYILFDPPENRASYTYCQRYGQRTGEYSDRSIDIEIEEIFYTAEGKEFLQTGEENPEKDEWYVVQLDSGLFLEFGAESFNGERFESYREEALPVLLQILGTYQTLLEGVE